MSLPNNYEPTHGRLHINIDRRREDAQAPSSTEDGHEHSISSADIRPPDAIPVINLTSIEFIMAFCETKTRATARKRPKRETAKAATEEEPSFADTTLDEDPSYIPCSLPESAHSNDQGDSFHSRVRLSKTPSLPNFDSKLTHDNCGKRKVFKFGQESDVFEASDGILSELACIAALADAGLRLSICLNLKGSTSNLKLKANTFMHCLAVVAPTLWRVGYASVRRVSVR